MRRILGIMLSVTMILNMGFLTQIVVQATELPMKNIALNKTATVSSKPEGWGTEWQPNNAVNGSHSNNDEGWHSWWGPATEWLDVNIGLCSINKVVIYPRLDANGNVAQFPKNFKIKVTNDNINWKTVVDKTNYLPDKNGMTFQFNEGIATHVKFEGDTTGIPNRNIAILEFEVWGYDVSSVPPVYINSTDIYTNITVSNTAPQGIDYTNNLCLNKAVVSSAPLATTKDNDFSPSNLTNGIMNTFVAKSLPIDGWNLTVDLGAVNEIKTIRIRRGMVVSSFDVSISQDGVGWTRLGNTYLFSDNTTKDVFITLGEIQKARYINIYTSDTNYWCQFDELSAYPPQPISVILDNKNDLTRGTVNVKSDIEQYNDIIIALYGKDNILSKIKILQNQLISKGENSMNFQLDETANANKITAMSWDSLENMKPTVNPFSYIKPNIQEISKTPTGTIAPTDLMTEGLKDPMGIGTKTPNLQWQNVSTGTNQVQTAYRILASSTLDNLNNNIGDMWDTNKVINSSIYVPYTGTALTEKKAVYWKVMTWDANDVASNWSVPARFETGIDNWDAKWIGKASWEGNILNNTFAETTARYVRINVTKVGPRASGEPNTQRLQIMEWQVFSPTDKTTDIALNKTVTASNDLNNWGWFKANLIDGNKETGYSSDALAGNVIDGNMSNGVALTTPVKLTLDLGSSKTFDQFKLFCRTDSDSINGDICPNAPKEYTIEVSDNGIDFTNVTTITPNVPTINKDKAMPLFATEFNIQNASQVKSARLYISGLGLYEARINGVNVSDTVLDPGDTEFKKSVLYVTNDVTNLIKDGDNSIGIMLGNGIYNGSEVIDSEGIDRYHKLIYNAGDVKVLAQLELTMNDGTVQKVFTDENWKQTSGPIVFTNWYGGEDYDATKEVANWDKAGTDRTSWNSAGLPDSPQGSLRARNANPIRVKETIIPKEIVQLSNGDYRVDMGRNISGIFEIRLNTTSAQTGKKIKVWPSELLFADGTVDQGATGTPIFDSYVIKGTGTEIFRPKFVYHGYRYLQIKNSQTPLTTADISGFVMRTDNEQIGEFTTSDETINKISWIINNSMQGNMYSTHTDCPHREKLGWLETSQLIFHSLAYNYDIKTWMKKINYDMKDAQLSDGMMTTTAPEFGVWGGEFRSDTTWGGACILVPWYTYQFYGDNTLFDSSSYEVMTKYMNYLQGKATNNLVSFGLGDWGAYDTSTPRDLVVNATYYQLATTMSKIAAIIGKTEDVTKYNTLSGNIKTAFNNQFYNASTAQYGSGSQASNACALSAGLVDSDQVDKVVKNLIADVTKNNMHLTTGEIGLRSMVISLAQNGCSDVVYSMATSSDMPSYKYFIDNGATSLPEFWDMQHSQNHDMMGVIEEWFYRYLVGIDYATAGFEKIIIKPFIPKSLERAEATTKTTYGVIKSKWEQNLATDAFTMNVEIPVGTTADIYVPVLGIMSDMVGVNGERVSGIINGEYILLQNIGSGSYTITR